MAKNQARLLAATTTKKTANFGNPNRIFTLMNDGSGSIFFRQQDEGRAFAGTAVELYALGGSRLKAGEPATMKGITWDYACASDTGTTAVARVVEGIVGASVNATLSGVIVNSDLETVGGVAVTVNAADKTGGTQVVNQATNGVNGVAFGLAADTAAVDGSLHAKLGYIGTALTAGTLAVVEEVPTQTAVADGSTEKLSLTKGKELRTRDQRGLALANCNDHTVYAVLGDDTTNKADSLDHVFGAGSITFDKADGGDDTVFAGVDDTFASLNFAELFECGAFIGLGCKIPDITDVVAVFVRVGTSAAHYNEWEWPVADLDAAVWMALKMSTATPTGYLGNGWNQAAVTYVAFGVEFSAETDALVGIVFDNVHLTGGRLTDSITNTDSRSVVSRVKTIGLNSNLPAATGAGASNTGTQRGITSSDSPDVVLLGKMYPSGSTAAAADAAGSGAWAEITLPANTTSVVFSVAGTCHIAFDATTPSGVKGARVFAEITYHLATPNGKMWAYGVGAAHAVYTTSFTRA